MVTGLFNLSPNASIWTVWALQVLALALIVCAYGTVRVLVDMCRFWVASRWVIRMGHTLSLNETVSLLRVLKSRSPRISDALIPWVQLPGKKYLKAVRKIKNRDEHHHLYM